MSSMVVVHSQQITLIDVFGLLFGSWDWVSPCYRVYAVILGVKNHISEEQHGMDRPGVACLSGFLILDGECCVLSCRVPDVPVSRSPSALCDWFATGNLQETAGERFGPTVEACCRDGGWIRIRAGNGSGSVRRRGCD